MTDVKEPYTCEICDVTLHTKPNYDTHVLGKKHQLRMHQRQVLEKKEKCSVFVSGLPNMVSRDKLNEYFKTLGPVLECYIGEGNKYAIVQFKSAETRENVLNKPHTFMGKRLSIKPRIVREQPEHHYINDDRENPEEEILKSIKYKKTFGEQLNALLTCIQPTNMYAKYLHLCMDLENVLSQIFPVCKAHPFGSTVSGLDFKGSDVDVYIEVPNTFMGNQLSGHLRGQNFVKMSRTALIKSPLFTRIIAIPKAKTPIVKCVHKPTNICCDFNFKNMLGVFNTRLVSFYLNQASKLRTAVIFLKCWGKLHGFVGNTGKISSYAIALMFVYYLQHWPYFMPPTYILQRDMSYDIIQEGWNGGFCNIIPPSPILQNATVEMLLKGFFDFYSNYEYSIYIISPFYGARIKKTDFMNVSYLPQQFERYITNLNIHEPIQVETPICIEDPFELNYNVTRSVTQKYLSEFIAFCKRASDISRSRNIDIYKLLSEDVETTILYFTPSTNTCSFVLTAGSSLAYLEINVPEKDKNKDIKLRWFDSVSKFITTILEQVFKFNVTVEDLEQGESHPGTPVKLMKMSENQPKKSKPVKLKCSANLNLWEARRSIMQDLHELENIKGVLEREIFISDYMANDILNGKVSKESFMDFEVGIKLLTQPISAEISITKISDNNKQYENFCQYFIAKLSGWFVTYEKELNEALKVDVKNT